MFVAQNSHSQFQLLSGVDQVSQMRIGLDFDCQEMSMVKQNKQEIEEKDLGLYQMTPVTNLTLFERESSEEIEQEKDKQYTDNQGNIQTHYARCHWYQQLDIFNNEIKYNVLNDIEKAYELCFNKDQKDQQFLCQNQFVPEQKQSSQKVKINSNQRRLKVQRYLAKKAKRSFSKKISYECRKNVADKRLRIKGRFVNKKLAQQIIRNELCKQLQIDFSKKQTRE